MPKVSENEIIQIGIKIDEEKCVGCGTCVEVCPVNLLELKIVNNKRKTSASVWNTTCVNFIAAIRQSRFSRRLKASKQPTKQKSP